MYIVQCTLYNISIYSKICCLSFESPDTVQCHILIIVTRYRSNDLVGTSIEDCSQNDFQIDNLNFKKREKKMYIFPIDRAISGNKSLIVQISLI